jgi:hypothetical protein
MKPHARTDSYASTMGAVWHARFAEMVRFVIAPLILFSSGFFTMDFLLSGIYTWPRTSRVAALTITIVVLAYEFVYKEQVARFPQRSQEDRLKILLYSCILPYGVGILTLVVLARLTSY